MVPDPPPAALVLSSPEWHEGVVGIVASRVAERFHRPAILLSEGDDEAKGSGRSIAAFDLLGAVERASEHLLAFGGHRAACGLRLRRDAIPAFREAFVARGRGDAQRGRPACASATWTPSSAATSSPSASPTSSSSWRRTGSATVR